MLSLLRGELYRLLRKRSTYIYFGALAVTYALLIYIRSGGFDARSVISDATSFFYLLPALAGGFLFSAIYTDDLNSKNLISLVGYGMSKTKIVFVKLVLMVLLSAIVFTLVTLLHGALFTLLGWTLTTSNWTMLFSISLKYFLMTVGFAALSGIAVYGLQRNTFAMVFYIVLSFNVVGGILTVALNMFAPDLTQYLLSGITDRIMLAIVEGGSVITPTIAYLFYLGVALVASVWAFHRTEMEF